MKWRNFQTQKLTKPTENDAENMNDEFQKLK